jgi:hypothetical protein
MTQPKPKRNFANPFQKKPTAHNSTAAYLRNVGKGKLRFADDVLKFYIVKGRITKKKDLVKQIRLADIQKVNLLANELNVTSQDTTDIVVVKDRAFAQFLYLKTSEFLATNEKLAEAPAPITIDVITKEEPRPTLDVSFSIVDSLFDALMCLQGRVDWNQISNYVKRCEDEAKEIAVKKTLEASNIDFSLLFSAVADRNVESFSKEAYRLLKTLQERFQGAEPELQKMKTEVISYYILNDIILAKVVGDAGIEDELGLLTTYLTDWSKGTSVKVDEIITPINRLIKEQEKNSYSEEARAQFKKQLLTILAH